MKQKTIKRLRILNTIILIALIIIITQILISYYQISRYVEDVYDCSDMSIDCATFFNFIGIKTRYVYGWYYDNTSEYGKSFHIWLELDFGFFKLPFESVGLIFISPTVFRDYNGIITLDYYYENTTFVWGNDIFTK